jgi:hypothetical protein
MQRAHRDAIDTTPDVQPNDSSHPVSKDKYRSQLLGANMLRMGNGQWATYHVYCPPAVGYCGRISAKKTSPPDDAQTYDGGHFSYAGVDHGEDNRDQNKSPEQSSCTDTINNKVRASDDYLACRNDGAAEHGHGERFEVPLCLLLEAQLSHATLVRHSSSKVIRETLAVRRVSIFGFGVGVHL